MTKRINEFDDNWLDVQIHRTTIITLMKLQDELGVAVPELDHFTESNIEVVLNDKSLWGVPSHNELKLILDRYFDLTFNEFDEMRAKVFFKRFPELK